MKRLKGKPSPLGATSTEKGINFALFSKYATKVLLWIEANDSQTVYSLDPKKNRTGEIWHILLEDLSPPFVYYYQVDGPHESPHHFYPQQLLSDPYAKCLKSPNKWGSHKKKYHPLGVFISPPHFDWQNVHSPGHLSNDLIIYEMHVRGFTQHPSSEVKNPGTFLGIIEKIPYLKKLGITAIELMPIQEFNESSYTKTSPVTHKPLCNYWGYSTVNYFCPMNRFATDFDKAIIEFKTLVRELHRNNIEVILDIVFNHTGEKGRGESIYSFMGIDSNTYYMLKNGRHMNYSGCGHTMNLSHPILKQFIKDVLHYWVTEMHVDGFRFDLATIMNRNSKGELLQQSALIEELSYDPILSQTKLIAEPWDMAAFQLGGFCPSETRWSEWNGKYRDAVRNFIMGVANSKNEFATRITGSRDIFPARRPSASINFVTAHDGFTLNDLVSYNHKHNESNAEHNRDGNSNNLSWNMGKEGETKIASINDLRNRQMKNFIVALFISRGVPMLLMGDEHKQTKKGNNNTWCQDNELNWFLWDQINPFTDFVQKMIQFRKQHPILSKDSFYEDHEIIWHGLNVEDPNWHEESPIIAFTIMVENQQHLYIAFNASPNSICFNLPSMDANKKWYQIVNTSLSPSEDFLNPGKEKLVETSYYCLNSYSSIILKLL